MKNDPANSDSNPKLWFGALALLIALGGVYFVWPGNGGRRKAERLHGVTIPPSSQSIQTVKWSGFFGFPVFDRGVLTVFEVDSVGATQFLRQLRVSMRTGPGQATNSDPFALGITDYWYLSVGFVPGNIPASKLKRTWVGDAMPLEAFDCKSTAGDSLYVEHWQVTAHSLIKLYTDQN